MQTFFLLRGPKMWSDRFIQELEAQKLPYVVNGKPGLIDLIVRPIQIYEVAYPQELYDVVQTTLFGIDKTAGAAAYPEDKMKWVQWAAQKALNAKAFPDWKTEMAIPITKNGLSILGLGLREDKTWEYGEGL